jgi:hypothetical protein
MSVWGRVDVSRGLLHADGRVGVALVSYYFDLSFEAKIGGHDPATGHYSRLRAVVHSRLAVSTGSAPTRLDGAPVARAWLPVRTAC